MKLARVYTTTELAAMIGWPRRKLVRHLKRMNAEHGGTLIKNVGTRLRPRWTVTLDALKQAAPQWLRDPEDVEARLEDLEDRVRFLTTRGDLLEETVRSLVSSSGGADAPATVRGRVG